MAAEKSPARRERLELAGDGALITAAILSVMMTIAFFITGGFSNAQASPASEIASALGIPLAGVAAPVITWLMHRRRFSVAAVLGGLIGIPVGGAVFWLFVAIAMGLGWLLTSLFDAPNWTGPVVAGAFVFADFVGLVVWLVIDAVRDYTRAREHRSLDVVRVLSAVVITIYCSAVGIAALRTDGEIVEAILIMLIGAAGGAAIVTMADVVSRLATRKTDSAPKPDDATVASG